MLSVRPVRRSFRALLLGMAVGAVLPYAQAQEPALAEPKPVIVPASWGSSPYCPLRRPAPCCDSVVPGTVTPLNPVDPANPNPPPVTPPTDINTEAQGSGPRGGAETSFRAPNMQGDLLFGTHALSFGLIRTTGNTNFFGLASASVTNSSVAENNSPVPTDRAYFRYNFFASGQSATGVSPTITPIFNLDGTPTGVNFSQPQTKRYDVNMYTFGVEKTFFDGLMSAELRVPIVNGLASHNTISATQVGNPIPGLFDINGNQGFDATFTPQNTLGHSDTEFGNMTAILKATLYQNQSSGLFVSGGVTVGIPTGEDTQYHIFDVFSTADNINSITGVRKRDVTITNETWAVTPFVAALWVPNDRLFMQGFLSAEIPTNSSRITYSSNDLVGFFGQGNANSPEGIALRNAVANGQSQIPPFTVSRNITEQDLLHFDVGGGYWVYRRPESRWLTGIAPDLELHYTTTLTKLRTAQLPGDGNVTIFDPNNPVSALQNRQPQIAEIGPVVGGGQPNRMNIVDLTLGTTFEFGPRLTLAPAVTLPLTNGNNRTFDWEFQLQLNYFFGANR